jgi:hypothetical protein
VFTAQRDSATPLLEQQFYVRQTLATQAFTDRPATAIAWAGGDFYLLRAAGELLRADLELVHTSADGVPDVAFGANGSLRVDREFAFSALCLAWTGSLLAAGSSFGPENRLYLLQPDGRPVVSFGTQGLLNLNEAAAEPIFMQIATQGSGAVLRLHVAYGGFSADALHRLRYT